MILGDVIIGVPLSILKMVLKTMMAFITYYFQMDQWVIRPLTDGLAPAVVSAR